MLHEREMRRTDKDELRRITESLGWESEGFAGSTMVRGACAGEGSLLARIAQVQARKVCERMVGERHARRVW